MNLIQIIASAIFITGYIVITLEHKIKINKAAVALFIGGLLWILLAFSNVINVKHELIDTGAEIFEIVVFLLVAMGLVEILTHYKFFDYIRGTIFKLKLSEKKQFILIASLSFLLSILLDNLTTTIVMVQIAYKFFKKDNLLKAVVMIVIASNAGGAFSPIGDVTTIMLWLAGKFSTTEIIFWAGLPSLSLFLVTLLLILRQIEDSTFDAKDEIVTKLSRSEYVVIFMVFGSFFMPILMNFFGLSPYIGLVIGFSATWIIVDLLKQMRRQPTHMTAQIEGLLKKADIASLKFFIGILLAVSALKHLHILQNLSDWIYGHNPDDIKIIIGNIGLGFVSAVLDNVPLTSIAIDMLNTTNTKLWSLLAITAGTGGSLLIIGSAAGVIAMGMVKELNFNEYLKIGFIPALAGYIAAILVWYLQYSLLP